MKKWLLILAVLLPTLSWAEITRENISISDYDITFLGVEKVDSLTAKDLYNAALVWIAKEFPNPQDVIKENTLEKIVLNGRLGAQISGDKCINCTLIFHFKDGRYKWEVMDCIFLEDELGLIMGHRDRPLLALPRYNRPSKFNDLIGDFSPMIDSFRTSIKQYQPGITPVPEKFSADW